MWALQSKEVSSVRQYMESILVNLALRRPGQFMQARLLPALQTYHEKCAALLSLLLIYAA